MTGRFLARGVVALSVALAPVAAGAQEAAGLHAVGSPPADLALERQAEGLLARADRMATSARAIRLPARATSLAELARWVAARGEATLAAEEAYAAVAELGFRNDPGRWSGLSPGYLTRTAHRFARLVLDHARDAHAAKVAYEKVRPRSRSMTCMYSADYYACDPGAQGIDQIQRKARGALATCRDVATESRYWDADADACEVLLATYFPAEFRRFDELTPVPRWVDIPVPTLPAPR